MRLPNLFTAFLITSTFLTSTALAQQKGVKVFVALFPAGDFIATTSDVIGSAQLLPSGEISAKDIRINLKSLKTGLELRDDHAKNKYLEVAKFPEAILTMGTGKGGKGTGILKVRGKDAKINGTYTMLGQNKFVKAEFKTKLSELDIKEINYKGVGVEDDIKVEVIVPVTVASAAATAPTAKSAPTSTPLPPKKN